MNELKQINHVLKHKYSCSDVVVGDSKPTVINLHTKGSLDPGFCVLPKGWSYQRLGAQNKAYLYCASGAAPFFRASCSTADPGKGLVISQHWFRDSIIFHGNDMFSAFVRYIKVAACTPRAVRNGKRSGSRKCTVKKAILGCAQYKYNRAFNLDFVFRQKARKCYIDHTIWGGGDKALLDKVKRKHGSKNHGCLRLTLCDPRVKESMAMQI